LGCINREYEKDSLPLHDNGHRICKNCYERIIDKDYNHSICYWCKNVLIYSINLDEKYKKNNIKTEIIEIPKSDQKDKITENEEPIKEDIKKKKKINKDIKMMKSMYMSPLDINYKKDKCLICQKNERTNSSYCDKCTSKG
jgi:hypothetical protein